MVHILHLIFSHVPAHLCVCVCLCVLTSATSSGVGVWGCLSVCLSIFYT